MRRVLVAASTSLLGTAVFFVLGRLLAGMVGSPWELSFCAVGAFLATFLVYPRTSAETRRNLGPSVIIVFSTLVFISIGHAVDQIFERHVRVDFEPFGMILWATIATSWWLIPFCALTVALLNRVAGGRAG